MVHLPTDAVFAFQTSDSVRFEKNWGRSEGTRGDWVIAGGENGSDLYVCPDSVFKASYVAVKDQPGRYRKVLEVLARKMNVDFVAATEEGVQVWRGWPM